MYNLSYTGSPKQYELAKRLNDNIAIVTADELQTITMDGESSVCKVNFQYDTVPGVGFGSFGTILVDLLKSPFEGLFIPFDNSFFNSFLTPQYDGIGGRIGRFIENGKKFYTCIIAAVLPDAVADFQINLRVYSKIKKNTDNEPVSISDFKVFEANYEEESLVYNVTVQELFIAAGLPTTEPEDYFINFITVSVEANSSVRNPKFFFCGSLVLTSSSTTGDGDCSGVRTTSNYILTFAMDLESRRLYKQLYTESIIGLGTVTGGTSQISRQNPNGSWTVETFPVTYCKASGIVRSQGSQYVLSSEYDDSLLSFSIDDNQIPIMYASEQKVSSVFDEGFRATYNVLVPDETNNFQLKYSFEYENPSLPFGQNLNNLEDGAVQSTSQYVLLQNSVFNFSYTPTFPQTSGLVTSDYVIVGSSGKNRTYTALKMDKSEKSLSLDKYSLSFDKSIPYPELGSSGLRLQRSSKTISFPTADFFDTTVQFFTGLGNLASFVSLDTRVVIPDFGVLTIVGSNYPLYKTTGGDFIFA